MDDLHKIIKLTTKDSITRCYLCLSFKLSYLNYGGKEQMRASR